MTCCNDVQLINTNYAEHVRLTTVQLSSDGQPGLVRINFYGTRSVCGRVDQAQARSITDCPGDRDRTSLMKLVPQMSPVEEPKIQYTVLKWAISQAGFEIDFFVVFYFHSVSLVGSPERLTGWPRYDPPINHRALDYRRSQKSKLIYLTRLSLRSNLHRIYARYFRVAQALMSPYAYTPRARKRKQ